MKNEVKGEEVIISSLFSSNKIVDSNLATLFSIC